MQIYYTNNLYLDQNSKQEWKLKESTGPDKLYMLLTALKEVLYKTDSSKFIRFINGNGLS